MGFGRWNRAIHAEGAHLAMLGPSIVGLCRNACFFKKTFQEKLSPNSFQKCLGEVVGPSSNIVAKNPAGALDYRCQTFQRRAAVATANEKRTTRFRQVATTTFEEEDKSSTATLKHRVHQLSVAS